MRIGLAQVQSSVFDFEKNEKKLIETAEFFQKSGSGGILVFPELFASGYPVLDLAERSEFWENSDFFIQSILKKTQKFDFEIAFGVPISHKKWNGLLVVGNGSILHQQGKYALPSYDVFDERRFFNPCDQDFKPYLFKNKKIGFGICEDFWVESESLRCRYLLEKKIQSSFPVDHWISISASPFDVQKNAQRLDVHRKWSQNQKVPLSYVNHFGAVDELLFDGCSFHMDGNGVLTAQASSFEENILVSSQKNLVKNEKKSSLLKKALILGIRSYFHPFPDKKALIGLSGGIDSALVAALAVEALGASRVLGIAMPGPYSASMSLEDAELLAKNLKIALQIHPIKFAFQHLKREWFGVKGPQSVLTSENLQSRLRGLTLMTFANDWNSFVLATGNKSELSMGYCTQYGDLIGAMAPIGDLWKTEVFELAEEFASIPERIKKRPPSAELASNQVDEDNLPPYLYLDPVLRDFIENGKSFSEIFEVHSKKFQEIGYDLHQVISLFLKMEFKRKQAPFVLRVSSKAFGLGRRWPLSMQTNWNFANSDSNSQKHDKTLDGGSKND